MINEEQANSMESVQNAIEDYNAATWKNLRSAEEILKDWVIAVYLDLERLDRDERRAAERLGRSDHLAVRPDSRPEQRRRVHRQGVAHLPLRGRHDREVRLRYVVPRQQGPLHRGDLEHHVG
jgi:hypothetical protein